MENLILFQTVFLCAAIVSLCHWTQVVAAVCLKTCYIVAFFFFFFFFFGGGGVIFF